MHLPAFITIIILTIIMIITIVIAIAIVIIVTITIIIFIIIIIVSIIIIMSPKPWEDLLQGRKSTSRILKDPEFNLAILGQLQGVRSLEGLNPKRETNCLLWKLK